MYIEAKKVEQHFRDTEKMLRAVPKEEVAEWLLTHGYFPESNVLPPTFLSTGLTLNDKPYNKDVKSLCRRKLSSISYPKTLLSSREFSIQHPWNYHDVVYYLMQEWDRILDILYSKDLNIFSYSMPIPVTNEKGESLSKLRAGRMIYEWIQMAENDLVLDASYFTLIARADITNFYLSIYTHSIAWAIEEREKAFADKDYKLPGNKIDRLIQYANDARTNGIPVGSALSDLISEIILSDVDARVSKKLKGTNFVAVRFKDDYRILCENEDDAKHILRTLASELATINLTLNERKTCIENLPHGMYRKHDRQYFPHSLRDSKEISFKTFEHTLLIALDVHREHQGTSILEKFLSELLDKQRELKIRFSLRKEDELNHIKKFISLLFLAKRDSEKLLSHVLSLIELVYLKYKEHRDSLKPYLKEIVIAEIHMATDKKSAFEVAWLIFFSRYLGLGITNFKELITCDEILDNPFVKSVYLSQNQLYKETKLSLFKTPKECKDMKLADRLDVFKRNKKA
jgi:hypothetical protein